MSLPSTSGQSPKLILAVLLVGFFEFGAAGVAALFASPDAGIAVPAGLSIGRLGVAALAFALAFSTLYAGIISIRRKLSLADLYRSRTAAQTRWLLGAAILGTAAGWVSVFSPANAFGAWAGFFSRLRPLLIAGGVFTLELWIATSLSLATGSLAHRVRQLRFTDSRAFWITLLCQGGVWLFMLWSGFGVVKSGPFWNPPGVPLDGLQGVAIFMVPALGAILTAKVVEPRIGGSGRRLGWLLALAIYVGASLVWGLTPMARHYFSLRPAPPSYQPFPFSDARAHDLGALSILNGLGIFYHRFSDKPLYMVFLAFLHVLAGQDYVLITRLQLAVLALIPIMLFVLGRQFHGLALGTAVALMTILQQGNSIAMSREIDSVNPRLLMTEVPTLLATTALAWLLFQWFRTRRPQYALASGAVIGAASLLRINPLFFLPVVGAFAVGVLWAQRSLMWKQLLLFAVGFVVVFSPWVVTGTDPSGVPWLWVKFQYVIKQRFQTMLTPALSATVPDTALTPMVRTSNFVRLASYTGMRVSEAPLARGVPTLNPILGGVSRETGQIAVGAVAANAVSQFLHNASAALLSLPDLLTMDGLDQLGQKDPWGAQTWQGRLTPSQHVAVTLNLILLSVGLSWSWKSYRLAGLVPAIVFLGYDLSLAVATTSGGRYIVPVNWAAHFYYALGWAVTINAVLRGGSKPTAQSRPAASDIEISRPPSWVMIIAPMAFLGLLIPLANVAVPLFVHPQIEERAKLHLAGVVPAVPAGGELAYGEVLYPYYDSHSKSVSFHLLDDTGDRPNLVVAKKNVIPYSALQAGSEALVVLSKPEPNVTVRRLYVASRK